MRALNFHESHGFANLHENECLRNLSVLQYITTALSCSESENVSNIFLKEKYGLNALRMDCLFNRDYFPLQSSDFLLL